MTLVSRFWANLSTLSMAVPSRLALWLGIACVGIGYYQHQPVFTAVGAGLILAGSALWFFFRPKGPKKRPFMVRLAEGRLGFLLRRGPGGKLMARAAAKRAAKAQAAEQLARAQADPRMNVRKRQQPRD
jgi:hypothetical protein